MEIEVKGNAVSCEHHGILAKYHIEGKVEEVGMGGSKMKGGLGTREMHSNWDKVKHGKW